MIKTGSVKEEIARPLSEKLELVREVITHHFVEFKPEEMAVAWSGGKDSTLVLYLVRQFEPNIKVVFNNTGVEWPETVRFIRWLTQEWNLNLIETKPERSFWDCVERFGFPPQSRSGTIPWCCYYLKEKPMKRIAEELGLKAEFNGLTASESWTRWAAAARYGVCRFVKKYGYCRVKPILFFTEADVWQTIKDFDIPVNEAYEKVARVGCMPCTGYIGWEAQMAKANPKMYEIIQRKRGEEYQRPLGV